ncbi:MAG: hypothetical protein SOW08_14785 [Lachnospiraceae bacterium]|nr:hypothetical protein [Lachnospiraceae bacterium]
MDVTLRDKFLAYSATEPMVVLRKRFNQGENLYKPVPEKIAVDKALEDVDYVQYVFLTFCWSKEPDSTLM